MKKPNAYTLYLIMGAAHALFSSMIFTVLTVYYVQTVGMNPLQLVLVGTTIELTVLLFEIPTGVVADSQPAACRHHRLRADRPLLRDRGLGSLFVAILFAEFIRGVGEPSSAAR